MARVDKPLRLLGVLDPSWAIEYLDTAETTATEADPRPGRARTSAAYPYLDPACTGAQGADLVVVALASGFPSDSGGLGVGYYLGDGVETVDDARGYVAPSRITDFHYAYDAAIPDRVDAAFCELSGHVVAAVGAAFIRLDPATGAWSDLPDPSGTLGDYAALTYAWGSERLLSVGRTGVYYSDDHGDTWAPIETAGALGDAVPGTFGAASAGLQYRAVVDARGAVAWFGVDTAAPGDYRLRSAASSDGGATWTAVSDLSDSTPSANLVYGAASAPDGSIYVVVDDTTGILCYRLESAFAPVEDADPVTVTVPGIRCSALTVAVDSNGAVWVYYSTASGAPQAFYSRDLGVTWTAAADVYRYDAATMRPVPHPHGGLAAPWKGAANGAGVWHLGGWQGPGSDGNAWAVNSGGRLDVGWYAFTAPTAIFAVNATAVGAGTYTTTGGAGSYASGGGGSAIHHRVDCYSGDRRQAAAEWSLAVDDDGGTTGAAPNASGIGLELRTRHAGDNAQRTITVWHDEAGYRVRDEEAGAWLTAKIAADLTTRTDFRVSLGTGTSGEVLHRADGATRWTRTTFSGVTASATAGGDVRVDWGHLTGTVNAASRWWFVRARGLDAPSLVGTANVGLGAARYPVPDAYDAARGRVSWLRVRGGPAVIGDEYELPADYGYPVGAVFPRSSPSPDETWRSTGTAAAAVIAVDAGADGYAGDAQGGIAWVVRNANVRRVQLRGRPDGGAWETVAEVDLSQGFAGLTAGRSGRVLYPVTGTAEGARYVRRGELRGGFAVLDEGGAGECCRRIRDNTAGWWGGGFGDGGPAVRVFLEEIDGTEPTTSFDLSLVWPSGVVVVHAPTSVYTTWALRIPAGELSPDTYFEVGAAYLFGVVALGKQWSGAEWGTAQNIARSRSPRGTERRLRLGPPARSLSLTWDDGAREARFVSGARTTADYLATEDGNAPVARDDVRGQIEGWLRSSDDGAAPVLVLLGDHAIEHGETITDPVRWLVGYLDGEVRVQPSGEYDPDTGEFVRVGSVVILEAV